MSMHSIGQTIMN